MEDGGEEVGIILSRPGCHAGSRLEAGTDCDKDTQGINSGGSPNDNMASDFSTPQFHAINYVSLNYVWFANTIVA